MSHERPYDPNLSKRLYETILNNHLNGVKDPNVISRPDVDHSTVLSNPTFEHYGGRLNEISTAVRGLGKIFSTSGRAELRARDARDQALIFYMGSQLIHPSKRPIDPVGIHAPTIGNQPRKPELVDLGSNLFWKDKEKPQIPLSPNYSRPNTLRSRFALNRMDRTWQNINRERNNAAWLNDSHGDLLSGNSAQPSTYGDRRVTRKASKKLAKSVKKQQKYEQRMHRIMESRGIRGRLGI